MTMALFSTQPRIGRCASQPRMSMHPRVTHAHFTCATRTVTSGFAVVKSYANPLRPSETPDQALQRRLKETEEVEARVTDIYTEDQLQRELANAGDKLVVLEAQSEYVCQTGLEEEAEIQWRYDQQKALEPCRHIKHVFQRTARSCPDVRFLEIQAETEEGRRLCDMLGITVLPTVQFYRQGRKLWEHRGVLQMEQDIGDGVAYYGDSTVGGVQTSDFVTELHSVQDFKSFVGNHPDPNVLLVVDVSLTSATPCVHVFPAVLALARSFKGYASFARLMGDENPELSDLISRELRVVEVPTFLFYRNGVEVMRHVGSSRGDLIGKILEVQSAMGIAPPPPPPRPAARRRR